MSVYFYRIYSRLHKETGWIYNISHKDGYTADHIVMDIYSRSHKDGYMADHIMMDICSRSY